VKIESVSGIFFIFKSFSWTNFPGKKLQWAHSICSQLRAWFIHDKIKTKYIKEWSLVETQIRLRGKLKKDVCQK